jgi:hypothetical protein
VISGPICIAKRGGAQAGGLALNGLAERPHLGSPNPMVAFNEIGQEDPAC